MILVLLGPPGVGKGTQAARIAVHYSIPAISTGAMFRDAIAQGTEFGIIFKDYLDRGEYVPDGVVIGMVKARIGAQDCERGFILDGFPRTPPQAEALDALLKARKLCLNCALDFEAPIDVLVQRFGGRRVCPVDGSTYHIETQPPEHSGRCDLCGTQLVMRPDDAPLVAQQRLELYAEKTAPLLDYYRHRALLCAIDATAEPETVFNQVVAILDGNK